MNEKPLTVLEIIRETEEQVIARPKGYPLGFYTVMRDLERRVMHAKLSELQTKTFQRGQVNAFSDNLTRRIKENIKNGVLFFPVSELATIISEVESEKQR